MKLSLATFSSFAFLFISSAFPASLTARAVETCPANALSCSSTAGSPCCSPTYGLLVLAQAWYQGLGPEDSFTMHDLWPESCGAGQVPESGCDNSRQYPNVEYILQRNQTLFNDMVMYWPSFRGPINYNEFWSHVWNKHGNCITTLNPKCFSNPKEYQDVYEFFATALQLHQIYDLYTILSNAGIVPGDSYSLDQFESAIQSATGFMPKVTCKGSTLNEIWLYFNVRNGNEYLPTDRTGNSTCSRTRNINYPVKHG
ncbi:RNase Sy [Absidia repens]|uniref:RNase Sy n=1 Tax=Absidia repens TaxID=90262 RepID=A0A1X2IC99_9FUNG|nr:RNase Sy [Absidia repens]